MVTVNNKETVKELYRNSGMIAPGETYRFHQLKLVTLGSGGVPAGEVQVRNTNFNNNMVENLTPSAYESEEALYDRLVEIANCNPEDLRDWLDRDK